MKQLFHREQGEQRLVDIPQLKHLEIIEPIYQQWLAEKRSLEQDDVVGAHWIKTCTGGYITEVHFHCDGTLDEYRLFDRFVTRGRWSLSHGLLRIEINKGDNTYCFHVVGNKSINIHSAIEYKNDELHSYLKLAEIKP
ncbi:hypothetical protein RCJ22_19520 [Vibrio sp. FNV 38]|nr:hypothetical protein [Vibrio sp. FNV 38]